MTKTTISPLAYFAGRRTELRILTQALEEVTESKRSKVVLLQGDFGVGKTALAVRFLADAKVCSSPPLIGVGRCAMETALNGLMPFSQLLYDLSDQGVQTRVALGSIMEFVKEVAPAWLDILTVGAASTTVKAAEKTVDEGRKLLGYKISTQENVFVQYANALGCLSNQQPVVAFIDDLQWADTSRPSIMNLRV